MVIKAFETKENNKVDKNSDRISIIIPVYNVEKYLKRCINSILDSSYENLEIILVDDGSSDGSYRICRNLQEKDGRVKVLHQENTGCTGARRNGLSVATGRYVGFVDPDDWIESDMYEKLYSEACDVDAEMVISCYYRDNDNGPYGVFKSFGNNKEGAYSGSRLESFKHSIYVDGKRTINGALWNKLFLREKITNIYKSLDRRIYRGEDSVAVVLYLLQSKKIVLLDKAYYHAYDRHTSLTHSVDIEYFAQMNYWYKQVYDYMINNGYKDLLQGLEKFYINILSEGMLKHTGCNTEFRYLGELPETGKMILYGAGRVGMSYFEQFLKCDVEVVLWIDKNAGKLNDERIYLPERIEDYKTEDIIIAVESEKVAKEIAAELREKYRIEDSRIRWNRPVNFENMIHEWIYG